MPTVKFCRLIAITRFLTLFLTSDDRRAVSSADISAQSDRSLKLSIGLYLSTSEPTVDATIVCKPAQLYAAWSGGCVPDISSLLPTLQNCRGPCSQYTGVVTYRNVFVAIIFSAYPLIRRIYTAIDEYTRSSFKLIPCSVRSYRSNSNARDNFKYFQRLYVLFDRFLVL